ETENFCKQMRSLRTMRPACKGSPSHLHSARQKRCFNEWNAMLRAEGFASDGGSTPALSSRSLIGDAILPNQSNSAFNATESKSSLDALKVARASKTHAARS